MAATPPTDFLLLLPGESGSAKANGIVTEIHPLNRRSRGKHKGSVPNDT